MAPEARIEKRALKNASGFRMRRFLCDFGRIGILPYANIADKYRGRQRQRKSKAGKVFMKFCIEHLSKAYEKKQV